VKEGGALRDTVLRWRASADEAKVGLSPRARLLLWDFSRGSLAYDLLLVVVLALLFLVPVAWWHDPLRAWP
jgi:hypothetical protein